MDTATTASLIGLRISYEDMANPYREGRVLRVESAKTPSGIDLGEIATIAWEEIDGTTRLDTMGAGQLRRLLERGNARPGVMGFRVVAK